MTEISPKITINSGKTMTSKIRRQAMTEISLKITLNSGKTMTWKMRRQVMTSRTSGNIAEKQHKIKVR